MQKTEDKPAVREEMQKWEPLVGFARMRESMEQMFHDFFRNWPLPAASPVYTWSPALDMYKADGNLVAEVAVPGFNKDEIDIHLEQDSMTIKGEYKRREEKKVEGAYHTELLQGRFYRSVTLPYAVKADGVKAKLDNGILKVTMPLANPENHKAKSIKID